MAAPSEPAKVAPKKAEGYGSCATFLCPTTGVLMNFDPGNDWFSVQNAISLHEYDQIYTLR